MANKKDLVEAQAFSRRRLLTAFVSGAPGGRELEPTKPMRAVVTGLLLSVLVVLGSLVAGLLKPGLAAGWDNNRMVVTTDSYSRYVALDGTLYPVLNVASARLLVSGDFAIVKVPDAKISDVPIGATVGIPGAPDAVPKADALVADDWLSCIDAGGSQTTRLSNGQVPRTLATEQAAVERAIAGGQRKTPAVLVEADGHKYVVTEGRRHLVPDGSAGDAVLRQLALGSAQPWPVSGAWLALFPPGEPFEALVLPEAGDPLPASIVAPAGAVIGSILEVTDAPTAGVAAYVIDAHGELAELHEVGRNLYLLGSGSGAGVTTLEVPQSETLGLARAEESVEPDDWPDGLLEVPATDDVCARLSTSGVDSAGLPTVQLVPTEQDIATGNQTRVIVDGDSGALVQPIAGSAEAAGWVHLIDATGTAYPLPAGADVVVERLGYASENIVRVPQEWLALFATGPALTVEGAQQTHSAGVAPTPSTEAPAGEAADEAGGTEAGGTTADAPDEQQCTPGVRRLVDTPPAALGQLGLEGAWELATGAGVTVAVVDSGVAAANEHLTAAVVPGADLMGDTDGLVDEDAHGTAVAGVIASRQVQGSGLVGVAKDATILPIRVYLDNSDDSAEAGLGPRDDRVAAGIRLAADAGAQIINVSISSPDNDAELADAVAYATSRGSLVVASAGNRGKDEAPSEPRYPAAYPEVLAVTAVDANGQATDTVQHGPHVDLVAPGQNVLTAFFADGDCIVAQEGASSSYATAYVSGAAALVAGLYPDETPTQWAYRLTATAARPLATERSDELGWGIVRPWAALTFVDDGTAAGPVSPVYGEPEAAPTPAPVTLSPTTDPGAETRAVALWWMLAAGAAAAAAALVSVPMRRRRATGRRPGTARAVAAPAGSTPGGPMPTSTTVRDTSRPPSRK